MSDPVIDPNVKPIEPVESSATAPVQEVEQQEAEPQEDPSHGQTPVPMKKIEVVVPDAIPAQIVNLAISVGMEALQQINAGRMMIFFPELQNDEDGKPTASIGKYAMLVLKPEDIQRVIRLSDNISKLNMATLKQRQAGNMVDALAVNVHAEKAKDQAERNANATSGKGIIVP